MGLFSGITIRSKITIFNIIIIIMTLYTLGYISNRAYFEQMLNRAVESSFTEMLLINNNLDNLINNMESQARLLSIAEGIQNEMELHDYNEFRSLDIIPETMRRAYFDIILSNPLTMSASLITSENRVLFFGEVENDSVREIMTPEIIKESKEVIKPLWIGPYVVELQDGSTQNVFVVVKSIVSRYTGDFLGTVFVYVKESHISNIYLNELIESNASYHIINDDGGVIISSNNEEELYQSYGEIIQGIQPSDISKSNHYRIVDIGGVSYLQNTYYFKKLDWRIINTIPLEEVTIGIDDVTRIILSVGIACSLVGLILAALISSSITRPLSHLAKSMKQVRNGALDKRIEAKRINRSEVGQLSRGFNELMDDMESLVNDIEKEQEKRRDYEFKLIQSQIKPHFLYNTIETIISCIKLDFKDTALKVSKSLANFYRGGSLSRGNDVISVREEVELTENYLEIQGFRYAEYMDYEVTVDEGINNFFDSEINASTDC